jgi:hypothetical protein
MQFVVALVAALFVSSTAQAAVMLTAAGSSLGFTLSTFASGGSNYRFLAAAALPDGTLAVVNNRSGLAKYNDVDGQTPLPNLVNLSGAQNIANAGGKTYASQTLPGLGGTGLFEVNQNTLALTPISIALNVQTAYGLAGNTVTGHLLASIFDNSAGKYGVADINPLTGATTIIAYTPFSPGPNNFFDGISVSPDGQIMYAADFAGGRILGYNIATHVQVFNSGTIPGTPDGAGVISGTALNGYIVVLTNIGGLFLINPTTNAQTLIATGFNRGDFTSPDSHDGSLLLADTDAMYRLSIAGGTIGGPAAVPEPASLAIF